MEQWSILSNAVNYAQYDRNSKDLYKLDVKVLDQKNHRKIYDRLIAEYRQVIKIDLVTL